MDDALAREEIWKKYFTAAKETVRANFPNSPDQEVLRYLMQLAKRGVLIELVLTKKALRKADLTAHYFSKLTERGGRVFWQENESLPKLGATTFLIIDDQTLLIEGSSGQMHCQSVEEPGGLVFVNGFKQIKEASLEMKRGFSSQWLARQREQLDTVSSNLWPTIHFRASHGAVSAGTRVELSWEATKANQLEITPGVGIVPLCGRRIVSPEVTTTYRLIFDYQEQQLVRSLTIEILQELRLSYQLSIQQTDGQEIILEQDPELPGFYGFPLGCRVYLSWQSHYAEKCFLSTVGELPLQGRMQLNLPQANNELLLVAQRAAHSINFPIVIKGFETPKISPEDMAEKTPPLTLPISELPDFERESSYLDLEQFEEKEMEGVSTKSKRGWSFLRRIFKKE